YMCHTPIERVYTIVQAISPPLETWEPVTTEYLVLRYPPTWQLRRLFEIGGPIALNNFGGAYGRGGIIPQGGAEIDVTQIQLPMLHLEEIIKKDLDGALIESKNEMRIANHPATQVGYSYALTEELIYKNVAVYVPVLERLHKFFLSYR